MAYKSDKNKKAYAKAYYKRNRKRLRAYARQYYEDNKEACKKRMNSKHGKLIMMKSHYKTRYGITVDEYNVMLKAQGGVCKICRNECDKRDVLSVDHCHKTGKVRGLLCHKCNAGLGAFGDNPNLVAAAAFYLGEAA